MHAMDVSSYAVTLRNFLDPEGRLKQLPAKHKMRVYAYCWLALQLQRGHTYTEQELNGAIGLLSSGPDVATLRRALVDFGFMRRKTDGSAYWLLDPMPTPESLGLG